MEKKIREVLEDINEGIISYDGDSMLEDGIIDSFDVIEIMSRLEEIFDVEIDAEYAVSENFSNADSVINMMKKVLKTPS